MATICVVMQDIRLGGGLLSKLYAFLRFAAANGHECDVYYPAERPTPADVLAELRRTEPVRRAEGVPVSELLPHFARARSFARSCRIDSRDYDAFQLVSGTLALAQAFVRAEVPFVAWVAGTARAEIDGMRRTRLRHFYFYNPITLEMLRRQEASCGRAASLIVVPSRYSAARVCGQLGVGPEKIRVVPNPVDLDRFRPGRPVVAPRRYVLSVSRLVRGKGFPMLLRAFREVAAAYQDVELRIAGDGPERAALVALAGRLGITDRVAFLGARSGDALVAEYRGASVFAMASDQEALSTVVLEAMACGLPVVSTACGGPADHVIPDRTGRLVPVGDAGAFAAALEQLLGAPERAARLGAHARDHAAAHFGVGVVDAALARLYAEAFGLVGRTDEPRTEAPRPSPGAARA